MMLSNKISHIRLRFFRLLLTILFAAIVSIGCSSSDDGDGGDGAGATTPIYTGSRNQANINQQNAEDIMESAFDSYNSASGFRQVLEYEEDRGGIGMPFSLALYDVLLKSANQTEGNLTNHRVALSEANETYTGNCGGLFTIYINDDDQTGDFTGNINFNNFCEAGTTISGPTDISGEVNLDTVDIEWIRFSFSLITITYYDGTSNMAGELSLARNGDTDIMVMDIVMKDTNSSQTFMYDDYTTEVTQGDSYTQFTISGRFYHSDYGYVNISTSEPFIMNTGNTWPSSGVTQVEGAVGSAGGNTMSRLTAIDSSYYEISADTNGDGSFDWHSGQLSWSGIGE